MLLPSPAILERLETKRAIEADRTVADVLGLAATASAYLYSAGVADATLGAGRERLPDPG